MASFLTRLRRRRQPAEETTHQPTDPTRPHPIVRDGIPIVHEGPPGFPGRSERDGEADR